MQTQLLAKCQFTKPKFWFGDRVHAGENRGVIIGLDYWEPSKFNRVPRTWFYAVKLEEFSPDFGIYEGRSSYRESELELVADGDRKHGKKFW